MQIVTNDEKKELKKHGNYKFPFLVSFERISQYEAGAFLWHWHPEIELTIITKGEMIYKINHEVIHLKTGDALFGNSNTLHAGNMINKLDCEYTSITFNPKLIYGYDNSIIYTKYVVPITQNTYIHAFVFQKKIKWQKEIIDIIMELIILDSTTPPLFEIQITMLLQKFWYILLSNISSLPISKNYSKREYDRVFKIVSYIEDNYSKKITLSELSKMVFLCENECCRLFKKQMKMSIFQFVSQYRIEKSIDYLINTKTSISTISNLVGFSDSNYFTKMFKKYTGYTPTQYRKRLHNDNKSSYTR